MLTVITDHRCVDHDPGSSHPERPARLSTVQRALADFEEGLIRLAPTPVDLERLGVHTGEMIDRLVTIDGAGGGRIDPDTAMSNDSLLAARLAAGAGLTAIDALDRGDSEAAFCAVRPPGHHATRATSMGFCLINNVAVTAQSLTERGDRVAIIDIDAHHGNGTQDIFYDRDDVLFVSTHQYPWYPGSGALDERGRGAGLGATINIPLPAGAAGDTYRAAVDDVVVPAVERFAPDWLLVSLGFDGHRADPLSDLGLTAGDFGVLVQRITALAPLGRCIYFLEGGYDLDALFASTQASLATLLGISLKTEASSSAGPGDDVVQRAARFVTDVPSP